MERETLFFIGVIVVLLVILVMMCLRLISLKSEHKKVLIDLPDFFKSLCKGWSREEKELREEFLRRLEKIVIDLKYGILRTKDEEKKQYADFVMKFESATSRFVRERRGCGFSDHKKFNDFLEEIGDKEWAKRIKKNFEAVDDKLTKISWNLYYIGEFSDETNIANAIKNLKEIPSVLREVKECLSKTEKEGIWYNTLLPR
jgi:hypothetical protein